MPFQAPVPKSITSKTDSVNKISSKTALVTTTPGCDHLFAVLRLGFNHQRWGSVQMKTETLSNRSKPKRLRNNKMGVWGPEDRSHIKTKIPKHVEIESIQVRPTLVLNVKKLRGLSLDLAASGDGSQVCRVGFNLQKEGSMSKPKRNRTDRNRNANPDLQQRARSSLRKHRSNIETKLPSLAEIGSIEPKP